MIIIDASVAVKWVVPEEGTPEALELRKEDLAAPTLWIVECANVLWRHVKLKEMLDVEAAEWLAWLRGANVSDIGLDSILSEAFILSNQLAHPIYDCLYLSAAIRNDTKVITADHRFVAAVSRQPILKRHVELLGKS